MAQLDVFRTPAGEYLVDCQADLLSHLNTRFVVPLARPGEGPSPAGSLNPILMIDAEEMIFYPQFAMAVPVGDLSERIASLDDQRFAVIGALDMLITGV